MNFLGIIPARYHSSRLAGKPLKNIGGKTMIQRVYQRAEKMLPHLYVATDHIAIKTAVEKFGGKVVLTDSKHQTGSSRCAEAAIKIQALTQMSFDRIINIQGDEPLLSSQQIKTLIETVTDKEVSMATLAKKVKVASEFDDTSSCFLVLNKRLEALYFSRYPIPCFYNKPMEDRLKTTEYYKHIGLYAFTPQAIQAFAHMPCSALENAESLEQNRWLEAGNKIKVGITQHESQSVNTPEDLKKVRALFK